MKTVKRASCSEDSSILLLRLIRVNEIERNSSKLKLGNWGTLCFNTHTLILLSLFFFLHIYLLTYLSTYRKQY